MIFFFDKRSRICDIITNFIQQKCLKCVIMNQNNVVYNTGFGCGNLNITARYAIENLVFTKNCVNTHTHTHSHRPYLAR